MGVKMSKSWSRLRREAILKKWPLHKQLEAQQDAANGDNTKLSKMNEDIAVIKEKYPKQEYEE